MKGRAAVVGAGSWGTALAKALADNGFTTRLWARDKAHVRSMVEQRENRRYLAGIPLPKALEPAADLAQVLTDAEVVVLAVPSHALRATGRAVAPHLKAGAVLVNAAKGIENDSLQLMHEVLEDVLPASCHPQLVCLSGPSFAREVALGIPTAVCAAGRHEASTIRVQETFGSERLRVYRTEDVVGVELGGALKNVIAIAAGASDGLGFGHNSRAALITRGLSEITRLAVQRGAHPLTLAGLSGMGDLILTCTGDLSRNRHVGMELGKGRALDVILDEMTMVAEGVLTTRSAHALASREGVEMPILEQVYQVLYAGRDVREAVLSLMRRAPRPERD